ncbi:MAG: hypothetical protein H7145_03255 [Akkermansiaceae bacterium]|nr:hypothetical protein [Armatimonadota bacterium]
MNTIHDTGFGDTDLERNAKAIFDAQIAPTLTDSDVGKYLIIDTDTRYFVLDSDDYRAAVQAVEKPRRTEPLLCTRRIPDRA